MRAPFRAFVVDQTTGGFQMRIQRLEQRDLPPGEVLIQVAYAAMNYKDALVCTARGKVAQTYPLVSGVEWTRFDEAIQLLRSLLKQPFWRSAEG
jgi:acrylyl-CoA reductase (NADPH)